jgi:adenine deaminase
MTDHKRLVNVARGNEPADLVIKNARILDVFTGQFFDSDVAIADGIITGFAAKSSKKTIDIHGSFLIPGLIDAHMHIESSQLVPAEFARAVLLHGTTTVIADPHEIANVLGLYGISYMLQASKDLPLQVHLMVPSCVPATHLENSGAQVSSEDIKEALTWQGVLGLGEVMNYPGVVNLDPELVLKLEAAYGRPIDGHAPGLSGADLWAYIISGPRTDHECTTLAEAQEKLRAGMHILIREGTTARNLEALLPLLTPVTAPFVHFCTDDCHPETLTNEGHMDGVIRKAIKLGVSPELAICSGTIHTARAYGLSDIGAVAPGYQANLIALSDLQSMRADKVFAKGKLVAQDGTTVVSLLVHDDKRVLSSINVATKPLSFDIEAHPGKARVIKVASDQVVTEQMQIEPLIEDGQVVSDANRDLLKLAVIERHKATGNVGLGLVNGFGLKSGALASSVAHDSHNIIVVGTNDGDMAAAVEAIIEMGGGQVVVSAGQILARMRLPVAGLMSDKSLTEVAALGSELKDAAARLGSNLPAPFMTLSFLALPVIPALKLTDVGLVDVNRFEIVPLFVNSD